MQYTNLKEFLNAHKANKEMNEEITHTSMPGGKHYTAGSYNIMDDDLKLFRKLYRESIKNKILPHLVERHSQYSPIVIDIDFKFKNGNDKKTHMYTHGDILNILKLYYKQIYNIFNVSDVKKTRAYIFQRNTYYLSEKIKNKNKNENEMKNK